MSWHRHIKGTALHEIASIVPNELSLAECFNSLGNNAEPHTFRHFYERNNDVLVLAVFEETTHKRF